MGVVMLRSLFIYGDIGENFDATSLPFIKRSGGIDARIAVLGLGGPSWEPYFNRVFRERWIRLGAQHIFSITPDENMEVEQNVYEDLFKCSGLLICGGDTRKYYKAYVSNAKMNNAINTLYRKGIPIAGVSAGALISTSPCTIWGSKVSTDQNEFIIRSSYDKTIQENELETGNGLGLIKNCMVEPHFSEFGGFSRLIAAMQKTSAKLGIGCDEPICLEITDETRVKIHGMGRAYYVINNTDDFTVKIFEPGQEFQLNRTLNGKVVSGQGNFSYWIETLSDYYESKTGMRFFPGTLNIQLDEPYDLPTDVIRLEKEEYGGTVSVSIQECSIFGRKAFILRTDGNASDIGDHPRTIVEVATDVKLRERYGLKDGDLVEVKLN
ncbi:DUF120 domain-containing protein [Paenibacillus sp. NPDC093718]|uniref:DUF120 domain-containing protein n=1 Tax=Paenibacillus sp. NPDC093718 TaxID=3390601 RepID=UPI003D030A56